MENYLEFFNSSEKMLKKRFKIKNLNFIEKFHLGKIVKACLKENKEYFNLRDKKFVSGAGSFSIEQESYTRWLFELYGLYEKNYSEYVGVFDVSKDRPILIYSCTWEEAHPLEKENFDNFEKKYGIDGKIRVVKRIANPLLINDLDYLRQESYLI
jgi:hypothetical protein